MIADARLTLSRRHLVQAGGLGIASLAVGRPAAAANPTDSGRVENGKVAFPPIEAETEPPGDAVPAPLPPEKRVGFALVGLGRLSLEQILPAFGSTRKARPVALVSGSPDKARLVAGQYGIRPEAVYGYDDMGRMADNPEIQVVYVVTPNAIHRENVLAAAKAGKHVLCEKPMAVNSAEARAMIDACEAAGVKLMIAYRCQYEPNNREVIRLARSGEHGSLKLIEAHNVQNTVNPDHWRLKKALAGGGALPDIGIYCLNATRYLTGEEPVEISAQSFSTPDDPRFREVEETVTFILRYPSGVLATCSTSYGGHQSRGLVVHTEKAAVTLENAFAYHGQKLRLARRTGEQETDATVKIPEKDQFALEMDHMATCVLENRRPRTPGEEGLQDHVLMEAIYESARLGRPVRLPEVAGRDVTRGPEPEKAG